MLLVFSTDMQDRDGYTPIILAANYGHNSLVKTLLGECLAFVRHRIAFVEKQPISCFDKQNSEQIPASPQRTEEQLYSVQVGHNRIS